MDNFLTFSSIAALLRSSLGSLVENSNAEVLSKSPRSKDMFAGVRSPLGPIHENKIETTWEGNNISPLQFHSSTDTYRLKENVTNQLLDHFSNKKLKKEIIDSENSKMKFKNVGFCDISGGGSKGKGEEMKKCPRGRSPVVSARRVISTRITHGVCMRIYLYMYIYMYDIYLYV
jgi:hypothetical protein